MKDLLQQADEIPVTLLVAIAYITMAFLTSPTSPTPQQLHTYGWLMPTLVSNGESWRLLSSAFLHGGLIHLAFNTYALLGVGPSLERSVGSLRMATIYVVSALGGSIAVCLVNSPFTPVVGGSGALFGMFGAIVALQMRQSRSTLGFLSYEGPRRVLGLIAINLLLGLLIPMVSNTAHVGGLLAGFAVTLLFMTEASHPVRNLTAWRLAFCSLVAGLLLHTLQPTTRWDWLWRQSEVTHDAQRREDLKRAAAISAFGSTNITPLGQQQIRRELGAAMHQLDQDLKEMSRK